ncbi:bifunctional metallophosphatase/5'-nucleotidase [Paenibacillus sp. TRM 82003]|uniref:bifunctional metallophosphatase/5'-nucleotidase n=1 Tax=Kineococcus sp. TRM81007 TaxID=2925831 RepID=UPI001F56E193|nr:bifunctional UDP-sugar hydrolase/5'-nucleotidase [Kineococcus sp. TRM81007]MCI2238733.1 bifunctional metallophosphatase/5'-nucleotidase [Kineococcus sp. TRM81007]MCI3924139.1 bifunctional metallophosphatase/5'-nucleotidase [Paenibacillus sp. TRM 82003]
MSRPLVRLVGPAAGLVAFTGSLGVVCAGLAPAALAAPTATATPTATAMPTATATASATPTATATVVAEGTSGFREILPDPAPGQTQIQIGAFNDLHGRLEAPDETEDGAPIGGVAQLAGALDALRAQQPNTVAVSVGDNIGASTFTSFIQQDEPTLEALNAMGVAVSAVGNHEFDKGYADLTDRVGVDGESGLAGFPHLGANVLEADGSPAMPAFATTDVGGVRVGFVGVVTTATPSLVAPDGIAGLRFTDPVEAANRVAAQLSDGDTANDEADVVVLLAHEGSEGTDCEEVRATGRFGELVRGASAEIDAILSGHTHQLYDCEFPVGGKQAARPVLSAESYGTALDRVVLNVDDATGEVVAQAHEVVPVQGFTPDAEVQGIVDEAVAFAAEEGARPVGRITADVTRAFTGAEDDRGTQSPLANLIADAQLQQTRGAGAQIALMNPGGVRDDLEFTASGSEGDGVVTYAEAAAVQPFANSVVTLTLTGAQVRQVLEEQWQPEGSSRPFLALGVSDGFFFTYDPDAPAGQHVTSVTLDGRELDPAATYRVTVNSFLASGGDNFATLAEGTERTELGRTDLEAFTAYLGLPENQPLTADREPRSAVAAAAPSPAPTTSAPVPAPTAAPTAAPAPAPTSSASAAPVRTTRPSSRPTRTAVTGTGRLARTGTEVAPYVAGGAGLVLVGGLLIGVSRRRGARA